MKKDTRGRKPAYGEPMQAIALRLPKGMLQELRQRAKEEHTAVSKLIRKAIEESLVA